MNIKVQVKGTDEINRRLELLARAGQDLREPLAEIGEHLLNAHRQRWTDERAPDGTPWKPLDPDYAQQKARKRPNATILVFDDLLRGLLRYEVSGNELLLGTDRVYGATHQFGRDHIPARPFLGLSHDDQNDALDILNDHLVQALNRS